MPKMPEHIKKLWLDALRSEKYPQGQCTLKNEQGYCCLGVLAHLLKENDIPLPPDMEIHEGERDLYINSRTMRDVSFLPVRLADGLGLAEHHQTNGKTLQRYLASLNDEGATFKAIADEIERLL